MTQFEQRVSPWLRIAIALSLLAVLAADAYTPLGIAVWVFYMIPLVLSFWTWQPRLPLALAGVMTVVLAWILLTGDPAVEIAIARVNRGVAVLTIWVVAWTGWLFIRARIAVRTAEWLQIGQMQLSARLIGEQRLEELGDNCIGFLCTYLGAQAGAIFVEDSGVFRRCATFAAPAGSVPEQFAPGEGLLGQAVKDARQFVLERVPENYFSIGSALGKSSPRNLLVAPASTDRGVNAVVELGFLRPVEAEDRELLARVATAIGVAVRSAKYRTRLQELLEETQRQSEELQAQSEELRVSNEELEEQSRSLRESQTRLEQQQVELEQTNAQLEEQTQMLEAQRQDLEGAKRFLEDQAKALATASRYKSDFLANMSHELRTPLNSSLILAKLLSENREGNLTPQQVEYAQTIESAGKDLLLLINDVLDLSKVESGRLELKPDWLNVEDLLQSLRRAFGPLAVQKGLELKLRAAPDSPPKLQTDGQRLEQILRNLLSNALKFTEQGEVSLEVRVFEGGRVAFAVRDTGIGIAPEQQAIVFEPFCQADGTTMRKYGGTGLGLSISRELARLLGGEVHLESEVGCGSTFTLVLPESWTASAGPARRPAAPVQRSEAAAPPRESATAQPRAPRPAGAAHAGAIEDDRGQLTGGRVILIVEDDLSFAKLLRDLAHQLEFQCLIAAGADEALALVEQHSPSAVLLDVKLPDHSGLFVLERLKRNARTRHIPVHVVSGADHTETALAMGASSYMLKPVEREKLVEALQRIETQLTRKVRRVLVVEDDPVQRESVRRLLASREVETVGVGTASECLAQLKDATFDCMVLDLTLPDESGFLLLEKLSDEDVYSFPPVVIYTGRELTADEEQRLSHYTKSIIIKGAMSPERLLDEVTLFLHQVVSELPSEQQKLLEKARSRDAVLEGRSILLVDDDVRTVFALSSVFEPRGVRVQIARNGREALTALEQGQAGQAPDLVLMDIMMPEMDGLTAMREIRKRPQWKKLPIIALTAKALRQDQERCLEAGANDYLAKPLDVEKLLSLARVWMPR
jgi:CheY-like chemotaxis protein